MHLQTSFILLLACFVTLTLGTEVKQCKGSKTVPSEVSVSSCDTGICRLKRGTTVSVSFKFKPEMDLKSLTVSGIIKILDVRTPIVGVDGSSACQHLFMADGTTPASCPLNAGQTYVYKDSFSILNIYPKLKVLIHWALTLNGNNVACFELPARIT